MERVEIVFTFDDGTTESSTLYSRTDRAIALDDDAVRKCLRNPTFFYGCGFEEVEKRFGFQSGARPSPPR